MPNDFSYKAAARHAKRTPGWLAPAETEVLYRLAKEGEGEGVILEIGSWCGKSAILLASGSKSVNREKVYAVDPFLGYTYEQNDFQDEDTADELRQKLPKKETYSAFLDNIKKANVDDYIIPLRGLSADVHPIYEGGPIRLLFIDGNHDILHAQQDWDLWEPLVVSGGWIVFHDSNSTRFVGPKIVSDKEMVNSHRFHNIQQVATMTIGQKK